MHSAVGISHLQVGEEVNGLKLVTARTRIPLRLDRDVKASRKIVVTLPVLKPGTYQVEWSALAPDDGHVIHGAFSFGVTG